jgi:thiamine-monophosphate kinase
LFATGTIGDAAAGLKARLDRGFASTTSLAASDEAHILDRYLLPRPRTRLASLIAKYANASMDISDGLLSDAGHMASASSSAIQINLETVPLSPALTHLKIAAPDVFFACLNGGDDYEILVSVPEAVSQDFSAEASQLGCPVTAVGKVVEGEGKVDLLDNGVPVSADLQNGFRHF